MGILYCLLEWLSADQAIAWIQEETGSQLDYELFFGLAKANRFNTYVNGEDVAVRYPNSYSATPTEHAVPIESFNTWDLFRSGRPFITGATYIGPACKTGPDVEWHLVDRYFFSNTNGVEPFFKPSEIKDFIESLTTPAEAPQPEKRLEIAIPPQPEKPLDPRERTSVAKIINVLAAAAGIDLSQPHKAEATFSALAANLGLEAPSAETTAKYFKLAREHTKGNKP